MEGLELAYGSSLSMWDRIPEPHLCVHLCNMLVQKVLQTLLARDFFVNGEALTLRFL